MRQARYILPGHPQHVIQRGNNLGPVFFAEEDYFYYLEKLQAAAKKYDCEIYTQLHKLDIGRQEAYKKLFQKSLSDSTLEEIRNATNKAWALGNDRFKKQIGKQINRGLASKPRGGDRKSEEFKSES